MTEDRISFWGREHPLPQFLGPSLTLIPGKSTGRRFTVPAVGKAFENNQVHICGVLTQRYTKSGKGITDTLNI